MSKTVNFTQMKDGTAEEYAFLTKHETEHAKGTADKLLQALVDLDEGLSGYKITRLGHSLQSATRAWRDGADIDWVVCALLHDIGDIYAPYNHDEYAAAILRPFVRRAMQLVRPSAWRFPDDLLWTPRWREPKQEGPIRRSHLFR